MTDQPQPQPLTVDQEAELRQSVSDATEDWRWYDGGGARQLARQLLATLDRERAQAETRAPTAERLDVDRERRSAFLAAQAAVRILSPRSKAIRTIQKMVDRADAAIAALAQPEPKP